MLNIGERSKMGGQLLLQMIIVQVGWQTEDDYLISPVSYFDGGLVYLATNIVEV
jgi:hypothetical protein